MPAKSQLSPFQPCERQVQGRRNFVNLVCASENMANTVLARRRGNGPLGLQVSPKKSFLISLSPFLLFVTAAPALHFLYLRSFRSSVPIHARS